MRKHKAVKLPNLMSAKLLLSYLSILAVPLLAIVVVYTTAANLMYTAQQERMYANLQQTALETQRNLQEASNLGSYISTMSEIAQLEKTVRGSGGKATFFQMYQLSTLFPDYTLFNTAIKDIYFFFPKQEYVICLPSVVPADNRSYKTIDSVLADDYDTMVRFLGDSYWDAALTAFDSAYSLNRQLGVLQSFPFGSYDNPFGTLLILLDDSWINERLKSNLTDGEGLVVVRDSSGEIIKQFAGNNNLLDAQDLDYNALGREPFSTLSLNGREYAVCSSKDPVTGYLFYSIVPKQVLVRRIGYIKPVIAMLSALSMVTGFAACVLLWSRRRSLLLRYRRYTDEFGIAGGKNGNLWDGLHAVLDSVAQLRTTVRLQTGFVRSGVIHKLLDGDYSSQKALEEDLATADIHLEGAQYCVASISFNRGFHAFTAESINEFRLRILECIEAGLEIPHYCCESEDWYVALVIPLTDASGVEIIKQQLCALEDSLISAQHVEAYIGMGACVNDLLCLSESYQQARGVCEYLRFYNIRSVMGYEEMPTSHECFHFPLEMELRLIRAIEQGSHSELQEVFSQLAVENFASRQLTYETHKRLLELVRSTALRTVRGPNAPLLRSEESTVESLSRADNLEQIFVLLEAQLPAAAQQNARIEDRKTDERKVKIRSLLEESFSREDLTIGMAAQQMSVSETKFYKEFKQLFGVTFSEYLENLRIAKACELLRAHTLVKDVSELVGYSSDYSFRRAFKRVMGITPSAYMENLSDD